MGNGSIAPPVSYEVDGEQYIAVMAGWGGAVGLVFAQPEATGGGPGRLLVYKLNGDTQLPVEPIVRPLPQPPAVTGDAAAVANGQVLYLQHCMRCHGIGAASNGVIADLRYMSQGSHDMFDEIVRGGIFSPLGMVSFADVLDEQQAKDVHQYIIAMANSKWEHDQSPAWVRDTKDWLFDKVGAAAALFM